MGRECGMCGEKGNTYGTLVGKPGRKRTIGGPGLRWEHNIKRDFKYDGTAWIGFVWFRRGSIG
jgi:hypothetical protein